VTPPDPALTPDKPWITREQVFALIEFTTNVHGMTAERVDVWNDFLDAHGIEVRDDPA
jgi:hypothetical protein